jgi:Mg-chelatase subunit ChlD
MTVAKGWGLDLTDPVWLWGLVALPILAWWAATGLVSFSRRQRAWSLVCRACLVIALVLALAGLTWLRPSTVPYVVFAIDRSLSIGDEAEAQQTAFIDRALENRGGSRVAFLGFAARPGPAGSDLKTALEAIQGDEARTGTDLAAALEAATGAIPPGYSPRVVLLSDGNATTPGARSAAERAGVPVWTVPLPGRSTPEVQVAEVVVPSQVRNGETFEIKVVVSANHDDEGFLEILDNNGVIRPPGSLRVKIHGGENEFKFTHRLTDQSFARIQARVTGFSDTWRDDNSAKGLVACVGKPRVLLVTGDPGQSDPLIEALTQNDIQVDPPRPPEGLPDTLAELQNYDLVILANVPATHPRLTQNHFHQLRRYVQELGGGLLLIGGDHAFGPGGYARSPIEDLLPVSCDFRKDQEKPSLAIALVLDKSGSMEGGKLEIVKLAARGAIELLGPKDQVGIVAFDTQPAWISPMAPCEEKGRVYDRLDRIEAEGGTRILGAMRLAGNSLVALGNSAKYKHMIVLSDGGDNEKGIEDFLPLVEKLTSSRITVSCVGVGGDAERALLEQVARRGGGRSYFPDDIASVPQIFAQETIQASKDAILEEPFAPILSRRTPVLAGLDLSEAPDLNGYVLTRIKPTSEQILVTHRHDPLLAWWRTGLGMCGAFTSDAQTRWAEPWVSNWPGGYGRFWTQVVRHLMRRPDSGGSETQVERLGTRVAVTMDVVDAAGAFLNDLPTELTVIAPGQAQSSPLMPQTAPGRYASAFDAPARGDYWMVVTQQADDQTVTRRTRGLTVGYPEELRLRPTDEAALRTLAEATGGQFRPDPARIFEPDDRAVSRPLPLWPYLVGLAVFLLVIDVALRRVEFPATSRARSGISFADRDQDR